MTAKVPGGPVQNRPTAGSLLFFLLFGTQLLLTACQDSGQSPATRPEVPAISGPGGSTLMPLDLVYVCGNRFLLTNAMPNNARVTYRVVGTNESGSLTLRPSPGQDPGYSETELETTAPG